MSHFIQREYRCRDCGNFVVIHSDTETRNKRCQCGRMVKQTGITEEIVGGFVIEKLWGKEVARRPIK